MKKETEKHSQLFYYLPSITDRKESINKWLGNVNLTLIDFDVNFIENFSTTKTKLQPHLLDSKDVSVCASQVELLRKFFRHLAHYSNQNLSRNVDCLLLKEKKNVEQMEWSAGSSNKYDVSKFKRTY